MATGPASVPTHRRGAIQGRLVSILHACTVLADRRREKIYLPAVSYSIGAGPYWKSLIRFGYDPCVRPEAYK